ncbi:MAG: hypothetical protein CMF50_08555 [Legionellales bacterium]|nr:hypothetical protein [Legionellales bacterium]|tara:strand:- start:49057 stop:50655 length:1599 start_codon:yes stop_codon:yes gene_type:complete
MKSAQVVTKPLWSCLAVGSIQAIFFGFIYPHFSGYISDNFQTWVILSVLSSGIFFIVAFDNKHLIRLIITSLLLGILTGLLLTRQMYLGFANSVLTSTAAYAMLCFYQVYHQRNSFRVPYSALFERVWNTVCLFISTAAFVGLVWLLLMLWATLFSVVEIDFFGKIFTTDLFIRTMSPIFIAVGLYASYKSVKIISFLRYILLQFCLILLPLLALISVLYVGSWIVMGFQFGADDSVALNSIYIIPCLLYLSLVFINAIYMDGQEHERLGQWYRQLVNGFIIVILMAAVLSTTLLVLHYHELSAALWISLVVANGLFLLYFTCYCWAILAKTEVWLASISDCNVKIAWALIALMLLINSPLTNRFHDQSKSYQRVKSSQQYKQAQQSAYERQLVRMKELGIDWLSNSDLKQDSPLLVLGYRNNQPLYACRGAVGDSYYPGEYSQGRCRVVTNNRITTLTNFDVLTGPPNYRWGRYAYQALPVSLTPSVTNIAVCRGIYNNRIHLGTGIGIDCWFVDRGEAVKMANMEFLWLK